MIEQQDKIQYWCALQLSKRYWEERYVNIRWDNGNLELSVNESNETNSKSDGFIVISLANTNVFRNQLLDAEATMVTNGDYTSAICIKGKDYEIAIAVAEGTAQEWIHWLEDCISIVSFMASSTNIDSEILDAVFEQIHENRILRADHKQLELAYQNLMHPYVVEISFTSIVFPIELLDSLKNCCNLLTLAIEDCPLPLEGMHLLCETFDALGPNLKTLQLPKNCIDDQGATILACNLVRLISLENFSVSNNQFALMGSRELALSLGKMDTLSSLIMSDNPRMTDHGVVAIVSSLCNMKNLKYICLDNCGAYKRRSLDVILICLRKILSLSSFAQLQLVDLQGNTFNPVDIKSFLASCSRLPFSPVIRIGKSHLESQEIRLKSCNQFPQMVDMGGIKRDSEADPEYGVPFTLMEIICAGRTSPERLLETVAHAFGLHVQDMLVLQETNHGDGHSRTSFIVQVQLSRDDVNRAITMFYREHSHVVQLLRIHDMCILAETEPENSSCEDDATPETFTNIETKIRCEVENDLSVLSCLNVFMNTKSSELPMDIRDYLRILGEALDSDSKVDDRSYGGLEISPLVLFAARTLRRCNPIGAHLIQAYLAALTGDLESCLDAAESCNKEKMSLSKEHILRLDVAMLRCCVIKDSPVLFLDMAERMELEAPLVRVLRSDIASQLGIWSASDNATRNVTSLAEFSRINRTAMGELRFLMKPRERPITRPMIDRLEKLSREDILQLENVFNRQACDMSTMIFKTCNGACPESAIETLKIAHEFSVIGMVEELMCQLLCHATENPSEEAVARSWRFINLMLRLFEISRELALVIGHTVAKSESDCVVSRWVLDTLQHTSQESDFDLLNQIIENTGLLQDLVEGMVTGPMSNAFELTIRCANGTGIRVNVRPFTSFRDLLEDIHATSCHLLHRDWALLRPEDYSRENRFSERWRDFMFVEHGGGNITAKPVPFEQDAYWWCLASNLRKSETHFGVSGLFEVYLESYITKPSWRYLVEPHADVLRTELRYWQLLRSVASGRQCVSDPVAMGYVVALAIVINESCTLVSLSGISEEALLERCVDYIPDVVYKSLKESLAGNQWLLAFADTVRHVASSFEAPNPENMDLFVRLLQSAFIFYLESWPLCHGVIFDDLSFEEASVRRDGIRRKNLRGRIVVNANGVFFLVLAKGSSVNWYPAVYDWIPLKHIINLETLSPQQLRVFGEFGKVYDIGTPNIIDLKNAIISQCTALFTCCDSVYIPSSYWNMEFQYRFPEVPTPPPAPQLFRIDGKRFEFGADKGDSLELTAFLMRDLFAA